MAETADAYDDFLFERQQVIALRQVLTEILNCADHRDWSLFGDEQMDEWRERAGLDPFA
jgi:hypothetical protein